MKKLIYKIKGYTAVYNPETEEVEQQLSLAETIVDNPTDEDIAKAAEIAYNGEYTILDDGQPEQETSSVWDDLDTAYQAGYDEGYTEGVNSAYDQ